MTLLSVENSNRKFCTFVFFVYICSGYLNAYLMLDRAQTIEKLKTTRQYLDEHYGVLKYGIRVY